MFLGSFFELVPQPSNELAAEIRPSGQTGRLQLAPGQSPFSELRDSTTCEGLLSRDACFVESAAAVIVEFGGALQSGSAGSIMALASNTQLSQTSWIHLLGQHKKRSHIGKAGIPMGT